MAYSRRSVGLLTKTLTVKSSRRFVSSGGTSYRVRFILVSNICLKLEHHYNEKTHHFLYWRHLFSTNPKHSFQSIKTIELRFSMRLIRFLFTLPTSLSFNQFIALSFNQIVIALRRDQNSSEITINQINHSFSNRQEEQGVQGWKEQSIYWFIICTALTDLLEWLMIFKTDSLVFTSAPKIIDFLTEPMLIIPTFLWFLDLVSDAQGIEDKVIGERFKYYYIWLSIISQIFICHKFY